MRYPNTKYGIEKNDLEGKGELELYLSIFILRMHPWFLQESCVKMQEINLDARLKPECKQSANHFS